jgi:hypothetical protein
MLNDAPSDSWIFPVEVLRELICKFARSFLDNIRTLEIQSGAPTFVTEAICSLVNLMPALKELKIIDDRSYPCSTSYCAESASRHENTTNFGT